MCGSQELGSIGVDGKAHRGRYLFISKKFLELFPPLTTTEKNDSALLPIIPLYSGEKVYCNLVYNNDKYHGSTAKTPRDEYRLYLNKAIENNQLLYKPGDILVFRKDEEYDENGESQAIYYLDLLNNKNLKIYKTCHETIKNSEIRGGYGIYNGTLLECEEKINKIKKEGNARILIDRTVTKRVIKSDTKDTAIAGLFNPASFRDFVMTGYEELCAVTRTVIKYNTFTNLEAAHIRPKAHGGLFLPNNGLA